MVFSGVLKQDLKEMIRQFTPNWFAANMGTGILALMVHEFPFVFPGQLWLSRGLWLMNVVFFALFTLLFLGRAILFPRSMQRLFRDPVQSLFIGAIPMAFATLINGMLLLWPSSPLLVGYAYGFWWIDVGLAILSVVLVPYFMFTAQESAMERMTAAWLLPIVPPEVTAASGGLLAVHLSLGHAQSVIAVSYLLWAISVPLAMGILAILFLRLTLHKLPHRDMAVSAWLPLGPLGTGALALLTLGPAVAHAYTEHGHVALLWEAVGAWIAYLLWGLGLWWFIMAALFTIRYVKHGLPFNMGWWGFTFPLGVYTAATYAIAGYAKIALMNDIGAGFTVLLAAFWIIVTWRSAQGMWNGELFYAPCLSKETGLPERACLLPQDHAGLGDDPTGDVVGR